MNGAGWTAVIGGVIAVVGQFWMGPGTTDLYLPLIGGVVAVIGGFMSK